MNKKAMIVINLRKNNLFLNMIRPSGETIEKFSAGTEKYDGAKKKTAIAKFDMSTNVGLKLKEKGYKYLSLRFTGRKRQYRSILKGFKNAGLRFKGVFEDAKNRAFNGCKKQKEKRKKKRG